MINVNEMRYFFYPVIGAVGSFAADLLGGYDSLIKALIVLMCIDLITGVVAAGFFHKSKKTENGRLESGAMLMGFWRKCMGLLIVAVGCVLDDLTGQNDFVRNAVIIALCIREVLSFIENATLMGYKPPSVIEQALEILYKKSAENKEDNNNADIR